MTRGATRLTSEELASLARTAIGERNDARVRASLERRRREDAEPASVARYLERVLGAEQPSREEEERLAQLAKDGHQWAREVLIAALLPRLVASARRYAGVAGELTDLIQEGVLASLEAVLRFEPSRGVPFWAYAGPWVRGAMSRLVQDQRRALRLPPRAMSELSTLKETGARLHALEGREPSLARVAQEAQIELARAKTILDAARPSGSLEEPLSDIDEPLRLVDVLADPRAEAAYDDVITATEVPELGALLGVLTEREREVIQRRFGLCDEGEESLAAIGRRLGVTRERARQIEARALGKMRLASGADSERRGE